MTTFAVMCAISVSGIVLSGCVGEDNVLKNTAKLADFAKTPVESKEFVKASRPENLAYIPVGTKVTRENRKLTPAEFKALEADLDVTRTKNEAAGAAAKIAGATPPPAPIKLPQ